MTSVKQNRNIDGYKLLIQPRPWLFSPKLEYLHTNTIVVQTINRYLNNRLVINLYMSNTYM